MENIRRNIKLFWVSHGGPIKLAILIIAGVILVVRGLEQLAIEKETQKENIRNQIIIQETNEDEKDIKLINKFLELCKQGNTGEAYALLSKKCKDDKFPTLEDFQENYFNKIFLEVHKNEYFYKTFNKKLDIEVEYNSLKEIYKITFNEDILESGNIGNRDRKIDYYKIELEESNQKIYINVEV